MCYKSSATRTGSGATLVPGRLALILGRDQAASLGKDPKLCRQVEIHLEPCVSLWSIATTNETYWMAALGEKMRLLPLRWLIF